MPSFAKTAAVANCHGNRINKTVFHYQEFTVENFLANAKCHFVNGSRYFSHTDSSDAEVIVNFSVDIKKLM